MKKINKILALMLAVLTVLSCMVSCASSPTVMTIGTYEVSYDMLRYFVKNYMNGYTDITEQHFMVDSELQEQLDRFGDEGKDPNPMAKGMSWMKTNVKLGLKESDKTIADLITDGCNMGVKSLNRYLNQYEAADERSKDITKRLINLEEQLAVDIRQFL
jgi:hypothetical protein